LTVDQAAQCADTVILVQELKVMAVMLLQELPQLSWGCMGIGVAVLHEQDLPARNAA
jgi:hypothetical protein